MNRINDVGLQLLEYKEEYSKEYPDIVKEALSLSIEQLVKAKIADRTAADLIKNNDVKREDFIKFLLESNKYSKTEEELKAEMEEKIKKFMKLVEDKGLTNVAYTTDIKTDTYSVIKVLSIDDTFIQEFFGVDDDELGEIMKKKGLAEKFSILRMSKVIRDIIDKFEVEGVRNLKHSLVYFNDNEDGFDIDFIYEIKGRDIEEKQDELLDEIEDIFVRAEKLFTSKMQIENND